MPKFLTLANHRSDAILFQEDLNQPARSRPSTTRREEPCQVPVSRSSYASLRICDVILDRISHLSEDNISPVKPTDCDFNVWRHCQKRINLRRSRTCVYAFASFAFQCLFVEDECLPRCTRSIFHCVLHQNPSTTSSADSKVFNRPQKNSRLP